MESFQSHFENQFIPSFCNYLMLLKNSNKFVKHDSSPSPYKEVAFPLKVCICLKTVKSIFLTNRHSHRIYFRLHLFHKIQEKIPWIHTTLSLPSGSQQAINLSGAHFSHLYNGHAIDALCQTEQAISLFMNVCKTL